MDSSTISRPGLLILLAMSLGHGLAFMQVPNRGVKVEFHWAEGAPGIGLTEAKVPKTGESIYLHKEVLITNEDITEAQALEDPSTAGGYKIALVFSKQAAERIAKATERFEGKRLAVLVEGRVISAPFLAGSIYDKAVITGEITKVEAERIARELNRSSRKKP